VLMLSARVKIFGQNAGCARFGVNIQTGVPARRYGRRTQPARRRC
jgi:hypothetical protein